MTVPTYKTLHGLIAAAETFIDQIDTISLDVFDTLFVRRIENPDLIKIPVARFVAEKANTMGIDTTWLDVARLRNEIEAQHRDRAGRDHSDHEACYDQFMPEMLERVFGKDLPEGYFESVADFEVKLENAVLVPRTLLVEWVKSLHQRGKRLLLMSDIYLPAKYIRKMVANKELDHYFEDIISSADSFKAKASGAGYELVRTRLKLDPGRWLHVGDNPVSDGAKPIEAGMHALVIDDPEERQRKSLVKTYYDLSTKKGFWKGRSLQQLMLPLESENQERDALYVQGYNQFGFLFGYFMQRLAERCVEHGLERLYFCSREGWLLKQCWERFAPWYFSQGGNVPEARYLYVSRVALARSMIANIGMSTREVEVALLPTANTCFADVCRIFGLDPARFRPYLEKHYLSMEDNLSQTGPDTKQVNRHKLGLLLLDSEFQAVAREAGEVYRDALVDYLNSEGLFELDEIGLVDIGWLGTIHNNLFQALAHLDQVPRIHGFLLGATRYIDYKNTRDRYFEGLVYDKHKFDLAGSLVQYVKDIMEEMCRAPYTSLLAYQPADNGTGFRLEFRPEDDESAMAEKDQFEYFRPLQQGVLDAVEAYAAAQSVLGYTAAELKQWLDFSMYKFIAFPRTDDIVRMRLKAHQDDFGKRDTVKAVKKLSESGLWQRSEAALRFVPGLRRRELWKHSYRMLKS